MPIREEDFAFTAMVHDVAYDVYHFQKDGKPGTMAFCKVGDQFVIAVMCGGHRDEADVRKQIESGLRGGE